MRVHVGDFQPVAIVCPYISEGSFALGGKMMLGRITKRSMFESKPKSPL